MKTLNKLLLLVLFLSAANSASFAQYCTGGPSSTFDSNVGSVLLTGNTTSINHTGCVGGVGVTGVEDLTGLSANVTAGSSYNLDVVYTSCSGNYYAGVGQVWIDWNQDLIFDASESVGSSTFTGGTTGQQPFTANYVISVPATALNGTTRMRVMQWEGGTLPLNPCGTFVYGSVMDFGISVSGSSVTCADPGGVVAAAATPTSANISWAVSTGTYTVEYGASPFVPGTGAAGVTVVNNATSPLNVTGLTPNTNYQVSIRQDCGGGQVSGWTTVSFITAIFCNAGPSSTVDSNVGSVLLTGNTTSINHTGCAGGVGVTGVENLTGLAADLSAGGSYNLDVVYTSCSGNYYAGAGQVWIDWDQDQIFSAAESVGSSTFTGGATGQQPFTANYVINVPAQALAGTTRMRVMQWEGGTLPLNPCGTFTWGSAMDFTITIVGGSTCTPPSGLMASATTATTATASWTIAGGSSKVEYGPAPFTPGTGAAGVTVVNNATSPLNITGLMATTNYQVSVQRDCGGGQLSPWATATFTTPCATFTPPFLEDFESTVPPASFQCWTQSTADNLNWTLDAGGTTSALTGPSIDHTFGTAAGNYIYLETSAPAVAGNTAIIESPVIDLTGSTVGFVDFWYHMYGATMGTMNFEIENPAMPGSWINLWTLSGDQGDQWFQANVDVSAYAGNTVKFRFIGVVGSSFTGDMAIDDFRVLTAAPPTPGFDATTATEIDSNGVYTVDSITIGFGASQGDADHARWFYFTALGNGTVDIGSCGQGVDTRLWVHTGTPGALMGYEAADDECDLDGDPLTTDYWSSRISGMPVTAGTTYYIEWDDHWETTGFNFDFMFYPTASKSVPYTTSFEGTSDGWVQPVYPNDSMNWKHFQFHTTPSGSTGPAAPFDGTEYLFLESSAPNNPNKVAILQSPAFDLNSPIFASAEFTFAYSMYGATTGSLAVEVSTDAGMTWTSVWSLSGNQGNQWNQATVDLSAYVPNMVWVRFVGITGTSFTSDIAIDKVSMTGICDNSVASTSSTDVTCPGAADGAIDLTLGASSNLSVQITEVGIDAPDYIEIANAGSTPVDVTGWVVVASNSYSDINVFNSTVWQLSGVMAPGQVMYRDDNTASAQYWGSNLFFNPGSYPTYTGWVAIVDNMATIRDIIFINWLASDIANMAVTIAPGVVLTPGASWTGNGVNGNCGVGVAITRVAGNDSNSSADFSCDPSSIGTISITGVTPTWTWSNGATTEDLTGLAGGVYSVTVNAGACSLTLTDTIAEATAISVADTTIFNETGTGDNGSIDVTIAGGTPPYQYIWSNAATTEDLTNLQAGNYDLSVVDANGCTQAFSFTVLDWVSTTPIEGISRLEVAPNPTNGNLNIDLQLKESKTIQVSVFNSIGQEIVRLPQEQVVNRIYQLNLNDQPSGLYHIRILVGDQVVSKQVILAR